MKEFIINNYLEDIRKKIPAYDLMLEIIFNSILKVKTDISQIKNILAIGGQSFEAKNLSKIYNNSKITIVEPSEIMLNIVKNECEDLKNLEYICDKFESYKNDKNFLNDSTFHFSYFLKLAELARFRIFNCLTYYFIILYRILKYSKTERIAKSL